jgi:hypothetical protein
MDHLMEVAREGSSVTLRLLPKLQREKLSDFDTTGLERDLQLEPVAESLEREIWIAMLLSPVTFEYPSCEELSASMRMRRNIVEAARSTSLAFHTSKIERPFDYWAYSEETGFTLLPGKSLIEALRQATQPEVSGSEYAFSCYRATEYVILLGIAQELCSVNPELLQRLQVHWERSAIASRKFHDTFMYEYGSLENPLPQKYYVPGDRVWFRNPDSHSSDVPGYEGSWVLYLGGGLFNNFWKRDRPFSLAAKCIEVYCWRHGTYRDSEGTLQMDESIVEERVAAMLNDPEETAQILEKMMRLRDAPGIYRQGGCIDASREYPRWVCPDTADIILPA